MLVFGDRTRTRDPRAAIEDLSRALDAIGEAPPGLARHGALAGAFVDASEQGQGLADAGHAAAAAAMRLVAALAHELARSWRGGARLDAPALAPAHAAIGELRAMAQPAMIDLVTAEGYAYYALYPEAYAEAARAAAAAEPGPRRVIGIRSIGTGLAAIVAAALDAPLPATVRPRGDPYARRLDADDARALAEIDAGARIAIVDEGPGRSGGSFGAVLDALAARGVDEARIELYPSHAGEPGPAASGAARARWRRLRRWVGPSDVVERIAAQALREIVEPLDGPLVEPLRDLSAGAWRARRFADEAAWPASVTYQERRKFLACTASGCWLARFVGLGRAGDHALDRAHALAVARLGPDVAGLRHGFLVERWHDDAALIDGAIDRRYLVEHLARYNAFRARAFPADGRRGASLAALLEMARYNAGRALGADAAAPLARWEPALARLAARARPIEVDARMHAWEWLVLSDGRLVKTDGVDHHAAHDLVGCQDGAWDVAGAIYELGLAPAEAHRLDELLGRAAPIDRELLAFYRAAYLAFQLGRHALAIDMAEPAEAARLRAAVERYAEALRAEISTI